MSPPPPSFFPSRLLTGTLIGLVIACALLLVLVLPAVLIFRLWTGVWPTTAAWGWIGTVLATQVAATAVRVAFRPPAPGPKSDRDHPIPPPDAHGSAPP